MAITKPDMKFIWASGGAIVEPSDTKKQLGWAAEVPPHQWENWIQNRQDQYLAHINERGIPEWDGLTNYLASGLSYVQGSDGVVYKSVAASGPSTTVQDPTTDVSDTYWTVAFADVGAFLTQASGDARYTQRSNNLSDVSNAATARTNLGVVAATETVAGLLEIATDAEAQAFTANKAIDGAKLSTAFKGSNQSLAASGYQKLPGGLILQWGTAAAGGSGGVNITFPITFPNAVFSLAAMPQAVADADFEVINFNNLTTTGFLALGDAGRWIAIGY